ncbi:MAG TPA: hypothetical protein VIY48_00085 [Candidatus Paceibacterota bacterium]
MKFKDDKIQAEVFVVAKDLLDALDQVDIGNILTEDQAKDREDWNTQTYRVKVVIYEA